ncbi:hypothetical protein CTEN210_00770 [Chaetoceros tenuissimus]|uniref:Coiled-coil domain-containing protein 130 n=1 Tax=Chaetoceros tenuissimus TaxID=426638 RepID=A0AAD3GZ09_9STRA|nr:hypothetical protein CTEN210_00770 [Chaetoceros tenuissimus]
MSSLNATQADGYYIPPDYINSGAYKKKSLNQYNKSKGHNQYLQNGTVRFELPYKGFCLSCQSPIGKGTRFNAQKKSVGKYLTSTIYEFEMKCRLCQHVFHIRTNPKEQCFDYVSGIKRKTEEFDTVDNKSLGVIDTEYGMAIHNFHNGKIDKDLTNNAIDQLQTRIVGKRKAMSEREQMEQLIQQNDLKKNDADVNSKLRASYRVDRKSKKKRISEANRLGLGKGILLDNGRDSDLQTSRSALNNSQVRHIKSKYLETSKFRAIRQGGIFDKKNSEESHESQRLAFSSTVVGNFMDREQDGNDITHESSVAPDQVSSSSSMENIHQKRKAIKISIGANGNVKRDESCTNDDGGNEMTNIHTPKEMLRENECTIPIKQEEHVVDTENKPNTSLLSMLDYGSDSSDDDM